MLSRAKKGRDNGRGGNGRGDRGKEVAPSSFRMWLHPCTVHTCKQVTQLYYHHTVHTYIHTLAVCWLFIALSSHLNLIHITLHISANIQPIETQFWQFPKCSKRPFTNNWHKNQASYKPSHHSHVRMNRTTVNVNQMTIQKFVIHEWKKTLLTPHLWLTWGDINRILQFSKILW